MVDEVWRDFRSTKTINWCQQIWTTNRNPCHGLPQAYRESKSVCPVCIKPTKSFYNTQGQVSGSINADMINMNKQVNNKWL